MHKNTQKQRKPVIPDSLTGVQKRVLLDVRREAVLHQARLGSRLLLVMAEEAAEALHGCCGGSVEVGVGALGQGGIRLGLGSGG